MIELRNISLKSQQKEILRNISLKIKYGKKYLILGPSGSGKTSLLKIINNLVSPTSGEVLKFQVKYDEISPQKIRKQVSLIMQDPILFGDIVRENFEFMETISSEKIDKKDFLEMMRKVGLEKKYFHKKNNKLSGGEKQRIAIIRTLLNKPEVILADEPFSALDKSTVVKVLNLFEEYIRNKDASLLIISHVFEDLIERFDEVIFMDCGKIYFQGNPQSFISNDDKRIKSFLAGEDE